MSSLRGILDRYRPLFEEGGKLEKLYPLYEMADTFLYTPGEVTCGATHVRDGMDLKRMMITVVAALSPCILMALYNTGYQANVLMQDAGIATAAGWRGTVIDTLGIGYNPSNIFADFVHGALYFLPVFLVCNLAGGLIEMIFALIRKHEVNEGFLVTGMLIPLTLPPTIPLWQVAMGTFFGVFLGKEIFGGTGKNFLNPALTARAMIYFAFPAQMTGDAIWTAGAAQVDGFSRATPLGLAATEGMQAVTQSISWGQAFFGRMQGSMGETSTLACLFGAFVLVATGIGSWRIMVSVLVSGFVVAGGLSLVDSQTNPMFEMGPLWHLVSGGFAFGLVFMATDPVSAAMTETGKWFYGALIGVMTMLIRVVNPAYPEGIMLAILLGNVFAPLIDHVVIWAAIKRRASRHAA